VPGVSGGMLFVGSCNSRFHALDARTGVPLWHYDILRDGMQRSFHGMMLFGDSLVFIGTDIPKGHIYAFDIKNGTVRWKHFAGLGVYGDIVGADSVLYALTKEDTLLCLKRRDGDLLWSFHQDGDPDRWNDSSPCRAGDRVLFRNSGNRVFALSAATGTPLWMRELRDDLTTTPCAEGGGVYIGCRDGTLYRLAVETGETEAELSLGGAPYGTITHDGGGLIFFIGRRGSGDALVSVEPDLGRVRWLRPAPPETEWTTYRPDIWNGAVLVGDGAGRVAAFRLQDGRMEWSLEVGGTVKTVSHTDGTLLVGTYEGELHAYDADSIIKSGRDD